MKFLVPILGFVFLASFFPAEAFSSFRIRMGERKKVPVPTVVHYIFDLEKFYGEHTKSKQHFKILGFSNAYEQLVNGYLRSFNFRLREFECSKEDFKKINSEERFECLQNKRSDYNCYAEIWKPFTREEVMNKLVCNDVKYEYDEDKQVPINFNNDLKGKPVKDEKPVTEKVENENNGDQTKSTQSEIKEEQGKSIPEEAKEDLGKSIPEEVKEEQAKSIPEEAKEDLAKSIPEEVKEDENKEVQNVNARSLNVKAEEIDDSVAADETSN